MVFSLSLYTALAIFILGLAYKVTSWFRLPLGGAGLASSPGERLREGLGALFKTLFSARIGLLLKTFFGEGLLQLHLLKAEPTRWVMHIAIFGGFMLLLIMHGLGYWFAPGLAKLFGAENASTANPFLFLRNLFGLLVLAGVTVAVWRRLTVRNLRRTTRPLDTYALVLLAVIMLSGYFLEALKITSHARFNDMVQAYSDPGDKELVAGLKAFWARNYAVVFPEPPATDEKTLARGKEANDMCLACHSRPESAFISYGVSRVTRAASVALNSAGVDKLLYHIHFLACFLGLAYLPFSKFFHLITTPLALMIDRVSDPRKTSPANLATRQAIGLDACTHCATCSVHCSVGVVFEEMPNLRILPSEKLAAYKRLAAKGRLEPVELLALREGHSICTRCFRCTTLCPAGIDLQDLWESLKEDLDRSGQPETFVWAREMMARSAPDPDRPAEPRGGEFQHGLNLSAQAQTFAKCFECQTCTNVCPVVEGFDRPMDALGLLPHQIMHSLNLGLKPEALSARMVWDCLTCYQCQENCPQGVRVTDVLYELRNMAVAALKEEGVRS